MHKFYLIFLVGGLLMASSCEIEEIVDPNNPTLGSVLGDASKAELQSLVTGLEARHRDFFGSATQMFGCFGREVWAYFASDPRFVNDWLGKGRTDTYPDFFASGGTYNTPYLAVKQANTLIQSVGTSNAVTTEEANAIRGFAKTIKAFQMIWPLMQQYQNGIRVDVADPLNPGPILPYDQALVEIRKILDEGFNDLKSGGSTLPFTLTSGWAGFNTPDGLSRVNRAIAARLALYAGDWQGALTALSQSFMDMNVTAATASKMNAGPALVWGEAPDFNNPLYYPLDRPTSTILIVHPAVVEDALPGDLRLAKFAERVVNPARNSSLNDSAGNPLLGRYQDARWATNTSPIPFIRNEELILIAAEANARTNKPQDAVNAINVVRNTWGLPNYAGATDTESLIEEVLFQRRYSLWAEAGHRWIDLRRTNRLNANYIDLRDGGNIYTQVARPTAETNWDNR